MALDLNPNMTEYIEAVEKVFSLISFKDIKKVLRIQNTKTLEIWGNYNAFEKTLSNPRSEMCNLRNMYFNNSNNYKRFNEMNWEIYLVGKLGYWESLRRRMIAIKTFLTKRTDLNIFTRIYLLTIKMFRSSRWVMQLKLNEYWEHQKSNNELLKYLFETNQIARLYLYKYKKELN
jgi:hypothetical protein